jgi:putative DNA primase/helicase
LLKFATFGEERSSNNSFRHNANVKAISGTELDYDGEQVSFEGAVATLAKARLLALIYTSPSHSAAKPRWRVVLPTSRDLPPTERERLAARVNGVLGGIMAGESFTLSQAFYYGRVGANADHRAVIVSGDFVDQRDDLDAGASGKNGAAKGGEKHVAGEEMQAPVTEVLTAFAVIPNDDLEWPEWNRRAMALYAATDGNDDGFAIFNVWSKKSQKHIDADTEARWLELRSSPPTAIGIGSIRHWASEACPGWRVLVHDRTGTIAEQMDEVAEFARLATMPDILYERMRKETAEQLGIRISALDDIIYNLRPAASSDDAQGTPISFDPVEPWVETVDGATLIADMVDAIRDHVILSEHQALTTALWVLHAHAIEAAEHTPRLQFKSPTVRCGKSTTLRTIKPMLPKPISTENITTAALFRVIEQYQPTLLIDEADSFLKREDGKDNEELRGIMNAGHARGGMVIRTVGDNHEPKGFAVFAPIAFAWLVRNGRHVSETLADRSITIELRRRKPDEKITRLRSNHCSHLQALGRKAARWVSDHMMELRTADPLMPEELGDRAQDNWRLLVAIADAISSDLGQEARKAAIKIESERVNAEDDASIMVLGDVEAIFRLKHNSSELRSQEILDELCKLEDRPWKEWRRGQRLTQNGLARLLKPFGLHPKKMRFGTATARGYEFGPVKEAADRYVEQEVQLEDLKEEF